MSRIVKDFYNANALQEWERLDLPLCRLEFASTLRLIDSYFPEQGRVVDIGGGPGRYTIELLQRGYAVTLVDLSEEAIHLAGERLAALDLAAEQLVVADAQDLSILASESFDAALLLGPMYHIIEPDNRAQVLRELGRVLKPGGKAIVAYLNGWGLMRTGLVDFPDQYRDLATLRSMLGERTFTGQVLKKFTESYWSTPEAALAEIHRAGFEIISYAGVESFANGMSSTLAQLAVDNPEAYANVLKVAAETCEEKQFRDSTDHLHVVVSKAG